VEEETEYGTIITQYPFENPFFIAWVDLPYNIFTLTLRDDDYDDMLFVVDN